MDWGGQIFGCVNVRVCVSVTIWLWPDPGPTHWQPSFALNSVPSAWLGDNAVVSALDGPYEGPTDSPWGPVSHPHWCRLGPWLAPHLAFRGAGVIPQELVAHLITVGNTWPFLQGEKDEEEGQKEEEKGETEERKKEKTSGEIWLSTAIDTKTQHAFLKHESPLMELGDNLSPTHAGCVNVCKGVSLCVCSFNTCTDNKHVEVRAMPLSKVICCT